MPRVVYRDFQNAFLAWMGDYESDERQKDAALALARGLAYLFRWHRIAAVAIVNLLGIEATRLGEPALDFSWRDLPPGEEDEP